MKVIYNLTNYLFKQMCFENTALYKQSRKRIFQLQESYIWFFLQILVLKFSSLMSLYFTSF